MKKRALLKELKNNGFYFDHHGGDHDIYKNNRGQIVSVPRHNEINERTAQDIIKKIHKAKGGEP